jgi:hypothetical protein
MRRAGAARWPWTGCRRPATRWRSASSTGRRRSTSTASAACTRTGSSDPLIADILEIKDAQATGIVDPDAAGEPILTGASEDHMRRLAADVLARAGLPVPLPAQPHAEPAAQAELAL